MSPSLQPLEAALYAPGIVVGYESLDALEQLAREYTAEHLPVTPTERALVDILIHTEWMLRRYRWLETEVWRTARVDLPPEHLDNHWPGHAFVAEPLIARIHRLRATA